MSQVSDAPPIVSAEADYLGPIRTLRWFGRRIWAFCVVECQKLAHDKSELITRTIQPLLWLVIFGTTMSQIKAIDTEIPYLDFITPGILAQSTLFVSVFYGIQVIWERDAGILAKLLATPTPTSALVTGKSFAAGIRGLAQCVAVIVVALVLGVTFHLSPWSLAGTAVALLLGSAFFVCLSMGLAGIVLKRERLMGIGQAITMPLFFASNALYPIELMPTWAQWLSLINPMTYQVNALRGLLLGTDANLGLDFAVLGGATVIGVIGASLILPRLVR